MKKIVFAVLFMVSKLAIAITCIWTIAEIHGYIIQNYPINYWSVITLIIALIAFVIVASLQYVIGIKNEKGYPVNTHNYIQPKKTNFQKYLDKQRQEKKNK